MDESSWQPMVSAAQRRRQRRLRSWWRHEQQSIAAALATSQHRSALRGQKKARAGEGDFELNFAAKIRRHPPPQAAGTVYYPMDVDDVPAARGSRPDRLSAVSGPQERVPRRIVEHIVDIVPVVQLLHVPAPQTVDSVVAVLKILDKSLPDVEQVIEVPKILQHTVSQRSSLQEPQLAEQLVDVPAPSPALAPVPQTEHQLVEVPPIVPQLVGFFAGADGYVLAAALWANGGLLVEGGLLSHPVGPPTGSRRQARAGYKYWPPPQWLTSWSWPSL